MKTLRSRRSTFANLDMRSPGWGMRGGARSLPPSTRTLIHRYLSSMRFVLDCFHHDRVGESGHESDRQERIVASFVRFLGNHERARAVAVFAGRIPTPLRVDPRHDESAGNRCASREIAGKPDL